MASTPANDLKPTYDQLLKRSNDLEVQLQKITTSNEYIWSLFSETMRGLQLSSTSIKVAVSSLLSHDIFWDSANQHEFLETINESTNRITQLVSLLTLVFRAEAGSLMLNPEPQVLQEILAIIHNKTRARFPDLKIKLQMSSSEKTVHIDYEYSIMAMMYLIDFMYREPIQQPVQIIADERGGLWMIDFLGFNHEAIKDIHRMHACKTLNLHLVQKIATPEKILGLHTACEILTLQQINNAIIENQGQTGLRLIFPAL